MNFFCFLSYKNKVDALQFANQAVEKDPSWIAVDSMEDIFKSLPDEILAQQFKVFLHCKALTEKKSEPVYDLQVTPERMWTGSVIYDDVRYCIVLYCWEELRPAFL